MGGGSSTQGTAAMGVWSWMHSVRMQSANDVECRENGTEFKEQGTGAGSRIQEAGYRGVH